MPKHFQRTKLPPSKTMSRKEKRKAERNLKKQRKDAYNRHNKELIKELKTVDSAYEAKAKRQAEKDAEKNAANRKAKHKAQKKKKRQMKEEEREKEEDSRIQGLRLAIENDEKELKQLAKNLHIRPDKKSGRTILPKSFINDGLDYILDATDSDKISKFKDRFPSGLDDGKDSEEEIDSEEEDAEAAFGGGLLSGLDEEIDSDEEVTSGEEEEEDNSFTDSGDDDEFNLMSSGNDSEDDPGIDTSKWDPEAKAEKSILKKGKKSKKKKRSIRFDDEPSDENSSIKSNTELDEENENSLFDEDNDDQVNKITEKSTDEECESGNDNNVSTKIKSKKRKLDPEEDSELKEDIYGRLKDKDGNIVKSASGGSYIPPAKRAMMAGGGNEQLRKKLKGLLNKVSESAMKVISAEVESLYMDNPRNNVNETMTTLIMEALVTPTLSPERIVAETVMLIAVLHSNVGTEIGAFFIQTVVQKFDALLREPQYGTGKLMENVLLIIANVYNFKIVHSKLIFGIMDQFISTFEDRDIELLVHILKTVGFSLRKDDPATLKETILAIQAKAQGAELETGTGEGGYSRVRFMLDVLVAIRNNNMRKIPSYDPTMIEHLRKVVKAFLKGSGLGEDQLSISLQELLKADQVGRWWIVGSAWEGPGPDDDSKRSPSSPSIKCEGFDKQMLRMAKKQGMNTDVRRHIFCILGTSEDYEDAFGRLLRLKLPKTQMKEVIHVLLHCCLGEATYNPYYAHLAQRLAGFDKGYATALKFSMWDKFKDLDTLSISRRNNLASLLSHLLLASSLSLSVFKVIEFGMESKKTIRFIRSVLEEILTSPNEKSTLAVFSRVANQPKLQTLRQGIQVFMKVHIASKDVSDQESLSLIERVERAEAALFSHSDVQNMF